MCCFSGVPWFFLLEIEWDLRLAAFARLAEQTAPEIGCLCHNSAGITHVCHSAGLLCGPWGQRVLTLSQQALYG